MAKKKYNREKFLSLCNDLRRDMASERLGDAEAFDIAESVLMEEEGLTEYLENRGIEDVIGYMANQIV